jgi:hypothetical protein
MAAMAGLAVLGLLVAGCSAGGEGVQDEGSAQAESGKAGAHPSPTSSGQASKGRLKINPVRLVKADPKVGEEVKRSLQPCSEGGYPMDVSYGYLTGGTGPDVVINVLSCGDAVAVGTYVYRLSDKEYENAFLSEEPAVVSEIDRGDLVVTRQFYDKEDVLADPSGQEVTTYRWTNGKFSQVYWVRNEYRRVVTDEADEFFPPEASPAPSSTKD